jgi:ribosomal-protein-alanine N-acetyltransferase
MLSHKGTQELRTERLLLRKIVPEDAEAVFKWMSDPEVARYECWTPHSFVGYSRGYIREVFGDYQSDRLYWWGIELDGELVGSVCVVNVDDLDRRALLGYALRRDCWSKGYTTEAVKAVLRYMFLEVGLNRLEATHAVDNPASGSVLQKAGFVLEGRAKAYHHTNSGFQDNDLYGLTRDTYEG